MHSDAEYELDVGTESMYACVYICIADVQDDDEELKLKMMFPDEDAEYEPYNWMPPRQSHAARQAANHVFTKGVYIDIIHEDTVSQC